MLDKGGQPAERGQLRHDPGLLVARNSQTARFVCQGIATPCRRARLVAILSFCFCIRAGSLAKPTSQI